MDKAGTVKDEALADPEATYASPADILGRDSLTPADKVKALESWAFTVRSRLDAVSEGMNSHTGGSYARDVDLIRHIEKALETLTGVAPDGQPPIAKRTGGSGLAP